MPQDLLDEIHREAQKRKEEREQQLKMRECSDDEYSVADSPDEEPESDDESYGGKRAAKRGKIVQKRLIKHDLRRATRDEIQA